MRKPITKIICATLVGLSAFGAAFASGCSGFKQKPVAKDDYQIVTSNGGFAVQTDSYVYFINGKAENTDDNKFGTPVKGSVQRIKKDDLFGGNYSATETIVPSIAYSGQYNAGIYVYGGYVYYATPSTQKDGSGKILNDRLDFKRTTLDGAETMSDFFWQSTDNAVDYRFVEVDGKVYVLYALAESLYGTSTTNIHSVDCATGENTLLAYNVGAYAFDTEDRTNPNVYYTMSVPQFLGQGTDTYAYNQLFRVRADAKKSAREYDFSGVKDYDAEKDPLYINYGDFVFDGIGTTQNDQMENRITQFNFAHWSNKNYEMINSEYTYAISSFKNGELAFNRTSATGSSTGIRYVLSDAQLDADGDGKVDANWDAVEANKTLSPFFYLNDSTTYEFVDIGGKTYAFNFGSDGITKGELINGVVENSYLISDASSATKIAVRTETTALGDNVYLYYSVTGSNGYSFNRIAIDGDNGDYNSLSTEPEWDSTWTYRGVKILELDALSGWYEPEFVGNVLMFAGEVFTSETGGNYSGNYVFACNLSNDGKMMTNAEINEYNKKFAAVTEKINQYNEEKNADGSDAYLNLSGALKYLFYTGDEGYLDKLIQAYVDVEGRDKEYLYSARTAEIYHEFAQAKGDWADYSSDYKTVNGKKIFANSRAYYYGLVGKMEQSDSDAAQAAYKTNYMKAFPVDTSTWWQKLSTVEKVLFIVGMCLAGLLLIAGIVILIIALVKKHKNKGDDGDRFAGKIDISDDKDMDVYGDE